jgi:hypothetical protein
VIHTTRAIYAMNWYDISPGLIYIQKAFSLTQVQLGILLTVFYIGVGIFHSLRFAFFLRYFLSNVFLAGDRHIKIDNLGQLVQLPRQVLQRFLRYI